MPTRLSRALTAERGMNRWTQRELAAQSGISLATIGAMERGDDRQFNRATLARLDTTFGWPAGHARTLMIDAEDHDTLATLPPSDHAQPVTIVIDGEITSIATATRGELLSRIITLDTDDGVWMLSRVSSRHTQGAQLASETDQAMPVLLQGDRVHFAFHFVPNT